MKPSKALLIGSVALAALVLGGCKQVSNKTAVSQEEQGAIMITYDGAVFMPAEVKAKAGQKILFKNTSSETVQVNSDPHPQHTLYPDLNVDVVLPNSNKGLTLGTAGTYKYHNHINASQGGVIVVE